MPISSWLSLRMARSAAPRHAPVAMGLPACKCSPRRPLLSPQVGWRHAPDQPIALDASGQTNNWVAVADQEAYEREEVQGAHERGAAGEEEEEEGGYSQIVESEFVEMLFATEPPAAPPQHYSPDCRCVLLRLNYDFVIFIESPLVPKKFLA